MYLTKRNLVAVILLSLFTLGIYQIYWFFVTAKELNRADSIEPQLMNYLLAILLGIITCGIYLIYWEYRFYKKVDSATDTNNWILSFLLSILFAGFIGIAIAQDSMNNVA